MDINLLALDVGNSRLKVGVFEAGELTYTRRIGVEQWADWQGTVEEAWRRIAGRENAEIAGASSNPALIRAVEDAVRAAAGQGAQWIGIGREIDLPIAVKTDAPERTGVDRILNVAAAYEQLGKACCVVDAGSAVTVDFCDDTGAFLGGVIAPGAAAQLRALRELAPHLPEVKLEAISEAFGTDTAASMNAGVYHGIRGLVRAVVEQHALTLEAWPEVIATGGDAHVLFGDDEAGGLIHAVTPDLIFYGIAHAYAEHHIRHRT
jgi:type III pantothenate kinase